MEPKLLAMLAITVVAVSSTGAFAFVDNETQSSTNGVADSTGLLGHIEIVVRDGEGNIKEYRQTDNKVVTVGLKAVSEALFGANWSISPGTFAYIGVGTGATAPDATDTNLEFQRGNKHLGTVITDLTTGANISYEFAASGAGSLQNDTGTIAITEATLHDSIVNASGNMFARQTFTPVNVGQSDSLTVDWTITPSSVN